MEEQEHPVILFDGVCNFCNAGVNFILRQDRFKVFRFAALQSGAGKKILAKFQLPEKDFDSFLLLENNKLYKYSTAGLRIYGKLPWYWKWTQVFWLVPAFLRDPVYHLIARNRYKWFGKKDQCMVPSADIRDRFLKET